MPGPYKIEVENHVLGSRRTYNTKYDKVEEACASAEQHAARSQPFMVYNVLDSRGNVLATFRKQA
jgi:hypothetical protein